MDYEGQNEFKEGRTEPEKNRAKIGLGFSIPIIMRHKILTQEFKSVRNTTQSHTHRHVSKTGFQFISFFLSIFLCASHYNSQHLPHNWSRKNVEHSDWNRSKNRSRWPNSGLCGTEMLDNGIDKGPPEWRLLYNCVGKYLYRFDHKISISQTI